MQLRMLRVKLLANTVLVTLQDEITDFVQATGSYTSEGEERSFVSLTVRHDGTNYYATILYTG